MKNDGQVVVWQDIKGPVDFYSLTYNKNDGGRVIVSYHNCSKITYQTYVLIFE